MTIDDIRAQVKAELPLALLHHGYSEAAVTGARDVLEQVVDTTFDLLVALGYTVLSAKQEASVDSLGYIQNVIAANVQPSKSINGVQVDVDVAPADVQIQQILFTLAQMGWLIIPPK